MNALPPHLPASRRTSYQFPVYRWIGWLAVGGFALGLIMMFFIAGMFGVPAPIGWAALVILITFGALLLDRPKLLLNVLLFYFLLLPGNRLFGLISVPLPGGLNKVFFLPFIAVIVMNWIQHRQLKEATLFPLAFCVLTGVSWYVNGKPSIFGTIQLTLVMMRCYILWYFCRLTCTFENNRQLNRWVWGYVVYIAAQFLYNILWQGGAPWPRVHPDCSGGVWGPMAGGEAHWIGYMSVFGLLLIAGWWVSVGRKARPRIRTWVILTTLVIAYNLIFMTDTKHVLVLFPFFALPLLLHPRVTARLKLSLLVAGILFLVGTTAYFHLVMGNLQMRRYINSAQNSPRVQMFYAVTGDLPYLVPYPLFGAGPGMFASPQAVEAGTPLARRYVIPYQDENRRRGYFGLHGTTASASVIGSTQSDFFILMGEYGWLATIVYYGFWIWLIVRLLQKSTQIPPENLQSGIFISLACCLIAQGILMGLVTMLIVPPLMYPIWILMGRMWDMQVGEGAPAQEEL